MLLTTSSKKAFQRIVQHKDPRQTVRATTERQQRTISKTRDQNRIQLSELVDAGGGEPCFVNPYSANGDRDGTRDKLPILIYVPGLGTTGIGANRQLEILSDAFEVEIFAMPLSDSRDFDSLLQILLELVRSSVGPNMGNRMVYILAEPFGAFLALAAAYECSDIIDRVILINPATGYQSSFWSNVESVLLSLPKEATPLVSIIAAPLLINPLKLLFKDVDIFTPSSVQPSGIIERGLGVLRILDSVSSTLDPKVVSWRLKMAKQGMEYVKTIIHKVPQKTMVISSENDQLISSKAEAERLQDIMLRAFYKILPGKDHVFMEDDDVNLLEIVKREGFYMKERSMSSTPSDGSIAPKNKYGKAEAVEVPSKKELSRLDSLISTFRKESSPVYFTTLEDGRVVQGLAGFPEKRPLMIVGNHTTLALDMNILIYHLISEKSVLPRGLAHPSVVSEKMNVVEPPEDDNLDSIGRAILTLFNPRQVYKLYTYFGAVSVNPTNIYRLLKLGECVLLYPGGAIEALKPRDMKYQLVWPDRPEFVRVGAKFGATVVTLASVGSEDNILQLMDLRDMLNSPLLGDPLRRLGALTPKARRGPTATEEKLNAEVVAPPLTMPVTASRQYFYFGKPVDLSPDIVNDLEKSRKIYNEFKLELENNISRLLELREEDPYKDFEKRKRYETVYKEQAPTFDPELLRNRSEL